MNTLAKFLYPKPAKRTAGGIVLWWESRRLQYNLIVGGTGLVSLAGFRLLTLLPPDAHTFPVFNWTGILAYGLLANACYLLGPTVELLVEKLSRGEILPTGPILYRMGLTFSVGLTLLPPLLAGIDWVVRIFSWIF
ncbi:MAG: hypothetical protein JSW71_23550 [Gemmatimonadota bacterium]|nr:MAG: hypothetical protein JSW71_23550 [Gemmatimonadota bacterium]